MVDDVQRGLGWPLFVGAGVSGDAEGVFTLPSGTVTFLLSDVEGSTRRWEEASEAMTVAVARYYELLDEAIRRHGGVRPVEQGEGDTVVGAFSRASDGVAAAVAVHQAFAAEDWPLGAVLRVRVAMHTGEAQLRDHGYYLGHALDRAARIRATGHGGQVLVSAATAALVADRLPEGVTLVDLGLHRLKDLGTPEHIWQVVHPDVPSVFPPLRSLDAFHHNLPVQLTPLIGRGPEIIDVGGLLAGERLVTLTGSAGVGKTRLALAVAAEAVDSQPGGVWWVELAPLADPGAVGRAALAALGARPAPEVPVADQLAAALGDEPSLLVFDNCEHLVAACAELVTAVLSANPSTSVLTTSREPLGVPGEVTWRVPSMRCPAPQDTVDGAALTQYDAVNLFIERARRARPSFAVSDANAAAIAEICHRLDGIPLAIELAAARCRQLSAERIANELDNRFRLLTGGARTVMARQQTLVASLDWSHERLDDAEQITFRRLGVFAGPFPLEAAEAVVAAAGDVDAVEVFDLISRLADKSLVVADEGPGGAPRYRLLESLRAYALDRARTAGELSLIRDAHAAWWADWLEPRGAMPTDDILEEIDEFHANLVAALNWSVDDAPVGLRLLRGVGIAWEDLGRAIDAMPAADRLLTDDIARRHGPAWLEAAATSLGLYFEACGPLEQEALRQRLETIAREVGDEYYLGLARWELEAPDVNAAVIDAARQRGDRFNAANTTMAVASYLADGDPVAAAPWLIAAQAAAHASDMQSLRTQESLAWAGAAASSGDLAQAIERATAVLEQGCSTWWSDATRLLSFSALLACDEHGLRLAVKASNRHSRTSPGPNQWRHNAQHRLALFEGQPGDLDRVLRGSAPRIGVTAGTVWLVAREAIDVGEADVAVTWASAHAGPAPHDRAVLAAVTGAAASNDDRWHDSLALALDHGLRLVAVDALEGLAIGAARSESWSEGLRLLGAAERLREETGYQWRFGFEQQAVDEARHDAIEALGDLTGAAIAEGRNLDWRDAAAYARRARGERKRPSHGWASLTPTEQQVVTLVSEGLTNPQIAERLLMGRATVKTHLEHIFTKLGTRTRAELAAEAVRRTGRPA